MNYFLYPNIDRYAQKSRPDEELELTHRAASRQIFVNGALHIARLLPGRPKGVYDLQKILFGA